MKRLSIALAAIGISVGAFAALPAATDPTLVAVPQFPGGFFVGATGYYVQPTASSNDLAFGYFNNPGVTIGTAPSVLFNNSNYAKIDPSYDWGWGVNAGYIFPGTANDVNVSYFNLDTDDTDSVAFPGVSLGTAGTGAAVSPFILQNPNFALAPTLAGHVHSKAEYDINQVDVTAGQYIDVGCRLILHPMVGMRWAELDRKITTNAVQAFNSVSVTSSLSSVATTLPANLSTLSSSEESDFSGVGPIAGIDASYYVAYGFGFVAHADAGLLVGSIDTDNHLTTTHGTNNGQVAGINQYALVAEDSTWHEPSTNRMVPVTDMKLGANYTYLFNNATNSDLTLEAGWSFSHYYDSVDRTFAASIVPLDGSGQTAVNIDGLPSTTSGVGFQGPYVNLTFHA